MTDKNKTRHFCINVTPEQFDELRTIGVYLETPRTKLGEFVVSEFINTMITDAEYQRFKGIDKSVGDWASTSVQKLKERAHGYTESEENISKQTALKAFDLEDDED